MRNIPLEQVQQLNRHGYTFWGKGRNRKLIAPDGFSISPNEAIANIRKEIEQRRVAMQVNIDDGDFDLRSYRRRRRREVMARVSRLNLELLKVDLNLVKSSGKPCRCGGEHYSLIVGDAELCPVRTGLQMVRLMLNEKIERVDDNIVNLLLIKARR